MFTFFNLTLPHDHRMAATPSSRISVFQAVRKEWQRLSPPKDLCFGLAWKAPPMRFPPELDHFPDPNHSLAKGSGWRVLAAPFFGQQKNPKSIPQNRLAHFIGSCREGELQRKCSCKPGWLWWLPLSINQPRVHWNPLSNCIIISESNFNCLYWIIRNR